MKTTVTFEFDTPAEAAAFTQQVGDQGPAGNIATSQHVPQPMYGMAPQHQPMQPQPAPYVPQPYQPHPSSAGVAPAPQHMAPQPQPMQPQHQPMPGPGLPPSAVSGDAPTVGRVTSALQTYSKTHGAKAALAVLAQHGVKAVAELQPHQYGPMLQSLGG